MVIMVNPRLSAFKRFGSPALRLAISAALLYWLTSMADMPKLLTQLTRLSLPVFFTAVMLHVLSFMLGGLRWWLLLKNTDNNARLSVLLPAYYMGAFFNYLLPTGVGGDAVRTVLLSKQGMSLPLLIASAVMDRFMGLLGVVLLIFVGIPFLPASLLAQGGYWMGGTGFLLIGLLFGVALAISWLGSNSMRPTLERFSHPKVRGMYRIGEICQAFLSAPGVVSTALLLTLLNQVLIISVYIILGTHLGIALEATVYFAIIPLVFLAANMPVSVGGLGVREGVLVTLLMMSGIEQEPALALSLLYLLILYTSLLPGLCVTVMKLFFPWIKPQRIAHEP